MWQILAQQALDLARERAKEARLEALAHAAREFAREETALHGVPSRPGAARALAARGLRSLSAVFESVSDAACHAAARVDGRSA